MNDSYENKWIEHYFNLVKDYFSESKYERLIKDSFEMFEMNSKPPFIFCLSANKDLLSQWRAYSHDGQGVSIGFNTKTLNLKNELPSPNVFAHNTIGIQKVEYSPSVQKKKIIELCEEVKESFDKDTTSENIYLLLDLSLSLVEWALIFKNANFNEEKEWRIIHTPTDYYKEPLAELSNLKFRLNSNRITTYFNYNFGVNFNSDLIKEIVVGPKCKMKKEEIEEFLQYNNLHKSRVIISKSTYR